jgi:GAF domain
MNHPGELSPIGLGFVPGQELGFPPAGLAEHLERFAAEMSPQQLAALLDPVVRRTLAQGFAQAGADEGTVWLVDPAGENLVPAHNTGPQAAEVVGQFRQPLRTGLVSMVFASEQPFLENEVWRNATQSKLLDEKLQVQTWAMIAVPFYLVRRCRGVISCVQLKRGANAPTPPGFRPEDLAAVEHVSSLLTRLLDFGLLSGAVGWPPN